MATEQMRERVKVESWWARRLPVQGRSLSTVMRVLDAASALLQYYPLDEFTTTRIAAEAGVSVGALYRFFPDRQSIIDTIAVSHVKRFGAQIMRETMRSTFQQLGRMQKPDAVAAFYAILDAYIAYLEEHPDFRTIALGQHVSRETRERQISPGVGVLRILRPILQAEGVENVDLSLRMVIEAGERLIAHAWEQPTVEERNRILAEMKRMLAGYLFQGRLAAEGTRKSQA